MIRSTYSSGIDSNAIVLVVDVRPGDGYASTTPNVEAVGISTERIASSTVNGNTANCQGSDSINAENLHRWVENVDITDGGGNETVSLEELWLGLTAVGSFAVPPEGSLAVKNGT